MNPVNSLAIAVIACPATAADTMMAYALSSKLTFNQTFASIDLHTTFHRPVTK
jgi:acyl-CoA thioesterase